MINLIDPKIAKMEISYRGALSAEEKLAVTLGYFCYIRFVYLLKF
jgi:hypothetical protein